MFEAGSKLKRIEESCFQCCCLSSICISRSVTSLRKSCFAGAQIETITFKAPSCLQTIEDKGFQFCSMKSVCIPRAVSILPQLVLTMRGLKHWALNRTNSGKN
jgi:hypothetical protein